MHRSIAKVALLCASCGTPQPSAAEPADAPASVDDAKRRFVLEVATKVDAIREAAAAGDFDRLGAQMCDDFDFGGATRGRDAALASWRADPTRLAALVRALEGDCALDEHEGPQWVCRPRAGTREQVSLAHDERGWHWCLFAASAKG